MSRAENRISWRRAARFVTPVCAAVFLAFGVRLAGHMITTAQITTSSIEPADQVDADVSSTFSQGPSGLYTYDYDVSSRKTSKQDIWLILVETTGVIADVRMPRGWFFDPFEDQPLVMWSHPYDAPLRPGQAKRFSITSPHQPETAWMYLQGYTELPLATAETYDLAQLNSAILHPAGNSKRVRVTAPQYSWRVQISVSPSQIDLFKPRDRVTVVAFGGSTLFSLRDVDPSTWMLGPTGAPEIHGTAHFGDFNADGKEDVELHFLTGAIGVRHGDNSVCLFGRAPGAGPSWIRGCAVVFVP